MKSINIGLKVTLLVISFGATRETDSTDEITFSYSEGEKLAPALNQLGVLEKKQHDFSKELLALMTNAASAISTAREFGSLNFSTLVVNLSYGVKWDFTISAQIPIYFVTLDPSLDHKKQDVQTVKLTFGHDPMHK